MCPLSSHTFHSWTSFLPLKMADNEQLEREKSQLRDTIAALSSAALKVRYYHAKADVARSTDSFLATHRATCWRR